MHVFHQDQFEASRAQNALAKLLAFRLTAEINERARNIVPLNTVVQDVKKKLRSGWERWIWGTRELRIYTFSFDQLLKLPKFSEFRVNSAEDLLKYRRTSLSQPSYQNFIAQSIERLQRGMSVYTYCVDDDLVSFVWSDPNPKPYFGSGVDQQISAVENSVYVQDAFTDPKFRSTGIAQKGFAQLCHDVTQIKDKNCIYLAVFAWNKPSRLTVEKLGAKLQTSYFAKTRFGFRKLWKEDVL